MASDVTDGHALWPPLSSGDIRFSVASPVQRRHPVLCRSLSSGDVRFSVEASCIAATPDALS